MAEQQAPEGNPALKAMAVAAQRAISFPLSRTGSLQITQEKAQEWAAQEAAFGTIPIDENGMSAGMKLNLMQPIRSVLSEWRQARADFDIAIQPKMADINAVHQAETHLKEAEAQREEELSGVKKRLEAKAEFLRHSESMENAKILWTTKRYEHGGQDATMFAYTRWYKVLLLAVFITELFINYDVLLQFAGIPAIAGGSAVLLAALLAFAAHGHGEILKQWSFRFDESRTPSQRMRDWRYFGLSTSALLIVLAAAGCSRYAAALQILVTQSHHSLLSGVGATDVNPLRDVLISLLANVAAWVVGVFLSYNAHDDDPDYMKATKQWLDAHALWSADQKKYEAEVRHIEAKFTKTLNDKRTAARMRTASVEAELGMLKQVNAQEAAILTEIEQAMRSNIATYREALTRALLASSGRAQLVTKPANTPLSPFELNAMELPGADTMQLLLAA